MEATLPTPRFVPLTTYHEYPPEEMEARARAFREEMQRRRSVRQCSPCPVARTVIEDCLGAALSAPSGANKQPRHFVVASDAAIKAKIRAVAEEEEQRFYRERAPKEWFEALAPLGTDENEPYLETAPYLIVIFGQTYEVLPDGRKSKNYYVTESVGIATGMLIAAIHMAGLAALTHAPSPMGFLDKILERPAQEKPYLILVVGYPDEGARVPDIAKRPTGECVTLASRARPAVENLSGCRSRLGALQLHCR